MKRVEFKKRKWLIIWNFFFMAFALVISADAESNIRGGEKLLGLQNLALYRPVSVSSTGHYPVPAEFAVDGELDTGWRSVRALDKDGDWLMVDLQAVCSIEAVQLTWASCANQPVFEKVSTLSLLGGEQVAAYALEYSILLSIDGDAWETVYGTTLGAGGKELIHFSRTKARFMRVVIHKRSHLKCGVGINELAVLGTCKAKRPAGQSWKIRRKAKRKAIPVKVNPDDRAVLLNKGWELTREDWARLTVTDIADADLNTTGWYNAMVPGTILATLVEQDVFPEPTIGMNCLQIPDNLSRHAWWYRTELQIPKQWKKKGQLLWLEFDGINYCAEVWLNTTRLGMINGAFSRGVFEISDALKKRGDNILAVRILPPLHRGVSLEKNDQNWVYNGGALGKDSPTFVASIGWDWMAPVRDRGMGIWTDVRLRRSGPVVIGDPHVVTDLPLPDTSKADILITVPVLNESDQQQEVLVTTAFEDVSVTKKVLLDPHHTAEVKFTPIENPELTVNHPKLWWPVGYGQQPLYDLTLSVEVQGVVSDTHHMRFGIRELSYRGKNLTPPPIDSEDQPDELEISVNGHRILCRGGNWGYPEILLRLADERMEAAVRLHHEANLNMIRNWVGQNTTRKFYDLCDEYGILVWNDFWLANPGDGPNPDNPKLFLENVHDTILRYRNHPSIAIWCGRNEGLPPKVLDDGMRQLTSELDGTRYYQSHSSDFGVNGCGPYKYMPQQRYFEDLVHGFKTEIGMPSIPSAESMRRMLADENPWPIDERWTYHDFAPLGNQYRDEYNKALETKFGQADGLDDYCRKAQMINYDGYRAVFEGCNHNIWNDSSGILLWMSHPAWPSTVWQVYDYWFGTDGAFFGSKKANEPIHIQYCPANEMVELINHGARTVKGTVQATLLGLDASVLWQNESVVEAGENCRTDAFRVQWPDGLPDAYLLRLEWTDEQDNILSENMYWLSGEPQGLRALDRMPRVKLKGTLLKEEKDQVAVQLVNDSDDIALMVKVNLRDADTSERILPAYYSENYISLMPGQSKIIEVKFTSKDADKEKTVSIEGWNIDPVSVDG